MQTTKKKENKQMNYRTREKQSENSSFLANVKQKSKHTNLNSIEEHKHKKEATQKYT